MYKFIPLFSVMGLILFNLQPATPWPDPVGELLDLPAAVLTSGDLAEAGLPETYEAFAGTYDGESMTAHATDLPENSSLPEFWKKDSYLFRHESIMYPLSAANSDEDPEWYIVQYSVQLSDEQAAEEYYEATEAGDIDLDGFTTYGNSSEVSVAEGQGASELTIYDFTMTLGPLSGGFKLYYPPDADLGFEPLDVLPALIDIQNEHFESIIAGEAPGLSQKIPVWNAPAGFFAWDTYRVRDGELIAANPGYTDESQAGLAQIFQDLGIINRFHRDQSISANGIAAADWTYNTTMTASQFESEEAAMNWWQQPDTRFIAGTDESELTFGESTEVSNGVETLTYNGVIFWDGVPIHVVGVLVLAGDTIYHLEIDGYDTPLEGFDALPIAEVVIDRLSSDTLSATTDLPAASLPTLQANMNLTVASSFSGYGWRPS